MKLALLIVLGAGALPAQPLAFTRLDPSGLKPSARFDGTIAYDDQGAQILLFGGQDSAPRNDLWSFSPATSQWTELQPAGQRPPARFGHTSIYDSARRRIVVFGGQAGGFFSDTWSYDIAANSWRQLSPDQAGPSRRYGHSAIPDPARDRMIVSHGFTDAGRFDDTWSFDLAANTWRNISPVSGRPLKRCLHHAVLDAANRQMYLYGGCASGFGPCPLGDLWAFDLDNNRWTERTSGSAPPPREHYGTAFDTVRGRMVIHGGSGAGFLNDTWEYDPRAGSWTRPAIAGDSPAPRQRHEGAWAADQSTAYFFGGTTASGLTNELWKLAAPKQAAISGVVNAFSGDGGAVAPGALVSIFGTGFTAPFAVTWNGAASPVLYSSATQLNVQVPYELENGLAEAELKASAATRRVAIAPARPGLFPRVFHADGSINGPANALDPGGAIVLFATGQGATSPATATGAIAASPYPEPTAPVILRVGGQPAEILFAGLAPGTIGVLQVNARIPASARAGDAPLVLSIGAEESRPITIVIR